MIFRILGGSMENVKIIVWTIDSLTISLDRAHRFLLGTCLKHIEYISRRMDAGLERI